MYFPHDISPPHRTIVLYSFVYQLSIYLISLCPKWLLQAEIMPFATTLFIITCSCKTDIDQGNYAKARLSISLTDQMWLLKPLCASINYPLIISNCHDADLILHVEIKSVAWLYLSSLFVCRYTLCALNFSKTTSLAHTQPSSETITIQLPPFSLIQTRCWSGQK